MRQGQTIALHASPGAGNVVTTVGDRTQFGSVTTFSVVKRRGDWVGVPSFALDNGRLAWIKLDHGLVGESSTPESVDIDLSQRRAELLDGDHVVHSFEVAIGAPASPTPTGTFAVTDEIQSGLNPVYGCCALGLTAHQTHLPPGWTGGDQIAIHGSPDNAVGEAISTGCVHATTADLQLLIAKLPLGAPVVIHG